VLVSVNNLCTAFDKGIMRLILFSATFAATFLQLSNGIIYQYAGLA